MAHREHHPEGSSDRAFGLVIAGVCLLVGLAPLRHGHMPRGWALVVASLFALAALLKPALLATLNALWTKFAALLGGAVGTVALAILFFGFLTPVAILIRAVGKDPLQLRLDREVNSYWTRRQPPGPPPDSMNNQF